MPAAVATVPKPVEEPKVKKTRKVKETKPVEEAAPVEQVPAEEAEAPKKKTRKPKQKVVEEPAEVQEESVEQVEEQEGGEEEDDEPLTISQRLDVLSDCIYDNINMYREMLKEIKSLKADYNREIKALSKKKKVKRNHKVNKDMGFLKPSRISATLAEFLGVPLDHRIRRPQVVSAINTYAVENDLKDAKRRSVFDTSDAKLRKLLGEPRHLILKKKPELGIGYSLHNLQTYLKEQGHFLPDEESA